MDSKDFRLLVALYENARQSFLSLGRRVSLSAPAVRDRLKRLERRGILLGYAVFMDPSYFDRDELLLFFRGGEFSRKDVAKALATQDVAWVGWKLEGGLTVGFWSRDRGQAVRDITAAIGARPSSQAFTRRQARKNPLSLLDLSIIDSLIDGPRMRLGDLIEATGLSPKTVRRHLEKLRQTEAIFIEPRLGALADSGELVYQLAVEGIVGMGEVRRIMGEAVLLQQIQEPPMKYILCRGSDLGDVTTKTRALGNLPDVESVTVSLNRELLVSTGFEHAIVRKRIQDMRERGDGS